MNKIVHTVFVIFCIILGLMIILSVGCSISGNAVAENCEVNSCKEKCDEGVFLERCLQRCDDVCMESDSIEK